MSKNTGGPAFPTNGSPARTVKTPYGYMETNDVPSLPGMTLRDYVAAKALQGFCANPAVFAANAQCGWKLVNATEKQIAEYCGYLADEMLAERDK